MAAEYLRVPLRVCPLLDSDGCSVCGPSISGEELFWLDEFLKGGLVRPAGAVADRPLVCLLAGPPGAGKSLLALQMCYGLAARRNPIRSLVLSLDCPASEIESNMLNLGWSPEFAGGDIWWRYEHNVDAQNRLKPEEERVGDQPPMAILSANAKHFLECLTSQQGMSGTNTHTLSQLCDILARRFRPQFVVVDSLTVISNADYGDLRKRNVFAEMGKVLSMGAHFWILVLDSPGIGATGPSSDHRYWEYVADIIIRLDYSHSQEHDNYFSRHLEVVKARFQSHVLGKQLVKIYPRGSLENPSRVGIDREGAAPNMPHGGMHVFPSEHYILSQIRTGHPLVKTAYDDKGKPRLRWASASSGNGPLPAASGPGNVAIPAGRSNVKAGSLMEWGKPSEVPREGGPVLNWPVAWCHELVGGNGVPVYHTTAIIGRRGCHKSYFCYQFLLDGVCNGERVLVISFRDNQQAVESTMGRLCAGARKEARDKLSGSLKTLYQRPGYVAPEEFLHRVIIAVAEHGPTRVMISPIDEWASSYPLLASSKLLIPALIDFLNTQGCTTMAVGVPAHSSAWGVTGLTSRAEVVLSFEYREIPWWPVGTEPHANGRNTDPANQRLSSGYAMDGFPKGSPLWLPPRTGAASVPKVVIRADRVQHGSAGLARAVVSYQYDEQEGKGAENPTGLRLDPLAPEFPAGIAL